MVQWSQFADEIFGVEPTCDADPTLRRCADRLESSGVSWIALVDETPTLLALSASIDSVLARLKSFWHDWTPQGDGWDRLDRRLARRRTLANSDYPGVGGRGGVVDSDL
jgi:hypothetical protein